MPTTLPIPLSIHLDAGAAYRVNTTNAFAEILRYGATRAYQATITNADEDGTQQPFDLTGWQFRHQVGTAVAYSGDPSTVPSVVVANADVSAFAVSGADNNVLSWQISYNTTEFLDAITDPAISKFFEVRAELWGRYGSGGDWEPIAQWTAKASGSIFDVSQTPADTDNSYYTEAQTDAAIANIISVPAGYRVVVSTDGTINVVQITP